MRVTPRQEEILRLVARGLSDKEVANRLGISRRTIRTHLEKLYESRGLHSRAEAVAAWLGRAERVEGRRPTDECPYPKPFPPDFHGCPAYQRLEFVAVDLSYRLLEQTWTCRHLRSRQIAQSGRWYGSCQLGDATARENWAQAVGPGRLARIDVLRQEMSALTGSFARRLWELKAEHVKTLRVGDDPTSVVRAMEDLSDRFVAEMKSFLGERTELLDELRIAIDACIELIRASVAQVIKQPSLDVPWDVPNDVLARFSKDMQLFLRPPRQVSLTSGTPE